MVKVEVNLIEAVYWKREVFFNENSMETLEFRISETGKSVQFLV